jgi:MFS family permease
LGKGKSSCRYYFRNRGRSFWLVGVTYPVIEESVRYRAAELGGVLLVLAMASVLSFPISGRWIDIYGPAKVTRYLALSTLITLVLISFATSLWGLALCVAFFGASLGALDVSMNGWGAEIERQGSKSIMSSLHAYWSLFAGLGGAFGFAAIHFELSVLEHFMIVGLFMGSACNPVVASELGRISDPRGISGIRLAKETSFVRWVFDVRCSPLLKELSRTGPPFLSLSDSILRRQLR